MRNIKILSIGLVLFSIGFVANAQTEKGNFLVGGESKLNLTFLNSKLKDDDGSENGPKTTNLEFSPMVGFFVADGFAVGLEVPISYTSEKDVDDDNMKTTSMAFAPFVRYYFGSSNIKPYLHGTAGLGNLKMKFDPASGSSEETLYGMFIYQIGGGLGIFLNEKVTLDVGLAYASVSLKPKENNNTNFRGISGGIGIGIGIVVVL
ncbi:MAG: outer membrane beta-barrel protein [Bacteroidales bacterium]|nr:outer membrane beta-barrel protein [Bacteroidales bacterium]